MEWASKEEQRVFEYLGKAQHYAVEALLDAGLFTQEVFTWEEHESLEDCCDKLFWIPFLALQRRRKSQMKEEQHL